MCTEKNKPHVHAELIKAWADGAKIQYKRKEDPESGWDDCVVNPIWSTSCDYRINPIPKVKKYRYVFINRKGELSLSAGYYENDIQAKTMFAASEWIEHVDYSVIEV